MAILRIQHRLKDNKTTEYPYHYLFFDTETTSRELDNGELEHTLRLGVALYWRRADADRPEQLTWLTFTTVDQFWQFVMSFEAQKRRLVVMSHNLPFDMAIVKGWRVLETLGFEPTKVIIDYRCNIWRFRKDTFTILLLDTMNYFQSSLETLGKSIGVAKLTMPAMDADDRSWLEYCHQDVNILYQAWRYWLTFIGDNDLGSFGMTIASQAFNAFRHRFLSDPLYIHNSNKATGLERVSYRGGRNECFRLGKLRKGHYYLLDVNSMYPFVMSTNHYPSNLVSTGKGLSVDECQYILENYHLIAECQLETSEPCFGVKLDGKLIFPVGRFLAVLTTGEIKYALERGYLKGIANYAVYQSSDLFSSYVNFFYQARLGFESGGNIAYTYLCKLFLNSLYGKFGQKIEEWQYVSDDPDIDYGYYETYDYEDKCVKVYRVINHRVEVRVGHKEGFNSFAAISSEVTANARLYLWQLIKRAGLSNVYYVDTDSLIVNAHGFARLKSMRHTSKLGYLKIADRTDRVVINNLKDYEFGSKRKVKGIRTDAVQINPTTFRQLHSVGIKGSLHRGDLNRVIWREVTKHLKEEYTKGVVSATGRISPIVLTAF